VEYKPAAPFHLHTQLHRLPAHCDRGSPAEAALDPARRSSEDILDHGEALFRIARSQSSLLSLWSDFQARNTGSRGP
jgi:hypothetical protein